MPKDFGLSCISFTTYFSELAQLLDDPGVKVDVASAGPDAATEVDLRLGSHLMQVSKIR